MFKQVFHATGIVQVFNRFVHRGAEVVAVKTYSRRHVTADARFFSRRTQRLSIVFFISVGVFLLLPY
jgi:S-methylmethionine-dependent homocysteine/selenocysteine methylase